MSYENQPTMSTKVTATEMNERLRERCAQKHFTIQTNGPCPPYGEEVLIPHLRPRVEVHWGDGPDDQIETNDNEVLCIVASNPYANVTIKNFTIVFAVVTQMDGSSVAHLPDGTSSVSITPSEMIGFGDLPPRNTQQGEHAPRPQVREVFLRSRGAKSRDYLLKLHYAYSVEVMGSAEEQFPLTLVKS